jgi:hypothetical protein
VEIGVKPNKIYSNKSSILYKINSIFISLFMSSNQVYYLFSLLGFIISNSIFLFFGGNTKGDKPDKSLIFNILDFKFHLHHWIIGLFLLVFILIIESCFVSPNKNLALAFFKGMAFGTLFHGIAFYTDYFNIFKK